MKIQGLCEIIQFLKNYCKPHYITLLVTLLHSVITRGVRRRDRSGENGEKGNRQFFEIFKKTSELVKDEKSEIVDSEEK